MKNKDLAANTLIEVVVSLVISSIILIFACSFFFTGETLVKKNIDTNQYRAAAESICGFITDRLEFSNEIEVENSRTISDNTLDNVLYISSDNYLGLKTADEDDDNIFGEDFYNGAKINVTYCLSDKKCITVTVDIMSSDLTERYYTVSDTVKPAASFNNKNFFIADDSIYDTQLKNTIISYN